MMTRRTFRYDPVSETFVEVTGGAVSEAPAVLGDIDPFRSPIDGSIVGSRSHLRDHMGRHGVVPYEEAKTATAKIDRYAAERDRRALREQLWEYTDRAIRTGKAT